MIRVRPTRQAVLPAIISLGLVLRAAPWLRAHTFLGVQESDDGVYYGAASYLLHGLLPYRDFTIVHPPGASVLLLPFAGLGALVGDDVGLAAARVAMLGVAAVNIVVVHGLARRLASDRVAWVAAAFYAVMPNAVLAERTVLLEPLVTLFALLAVRTVLSGTEVTHRRATLAGVLTVAAVSVKLFACLYVGVLGLYLLLVVGRRSLLDYVAGVALGVAAFLVPFAALAPTTFWHDVVATQLGRPTDATDSGVGRLVNLLGLADLTLYVGVPVAALLLAALARRGLPSRAQSLWFALLVLGAAAFITSPSYFPHYGAFLAPAIGLTLLRLTSRRADLAVVGLVLAVCLGGSVRADVRSRGQGDLGAAARRIPTGACVFAELTSFAVAADRLAVPRRDCPAWVDGRGVAYTQNLHWPKDRSFYPAGFVEDLSWQHGVRAQLAAADFLLLGEPASQVPEWAADTRAYAVAHFTRVVVLDGPGHASVELWERHLKG